MTDKSILDRLDSWAQVVGPANNIYADAAAHIRALMAEAERERAKAQAPRPTLWERLTKRGKE